MKLKILILLILSVFHGWHISVADMVTVGEERFFIAHSEEDPKAGSLKEFLPKGETLENWTTMVAVREFKSVRSPKKYIDNMANEYRKRLPHMQFAIMQKPDSDAWMIDYILYPFGEESGHVEWNYFLARKNPEGNGIIVEQYVKREPYNGSLEDVFKTWDIGSYRKKMLGILLPEPFKITTVEQIGRGNE